MTRWMDINPRQLERDFHSIVTMDANILRCQPQDSANSRCSDRISSPTQSWENAVQQLVTVRRLFEAAFDTKDLYIEALYCSVTLFVLVFGTCAKHQGNYTGKDWTKLYRGVTAASGHGLRNEDLHEATLQAIGWEAIPDQCENGDRD